MSNMNCEHLDLESVSPWAPESLNKIASSPRGWSYTVKREKPHPQCLLELAAKKEFHAGLLVAMSSVSSLHLWNPKTQRAACEVKFRHLPFAMGQRSDWKCLQGQPTEQALLPSLPVASYLRASCAQGPGSQTVLRPPTSLQQTQRSTVGYLNENEFKIIYI